MDVPTYARTLLVTDAAINIAPGLKEKVDIAQNAIDLAHVLGVAEPKMAILAAVEAVNPEMPSTLDAAALMQDGRSRADHRRGARRSSGLRQCDQSRRPPGRRSISSAVAGQADILVVPDLEAGNILAKQLVVPYGCRRGRHRHGHPGPDRADQPGRLDPDPAGLDGGPGAWWPHARRQGKFPIR